MLQIIVAREFAKLIVASTVKYFSIVIYREITFARKQIECDNFW